MSLDRSAGRRYALLAACSLMIAALLAGIATSLAAGEPSVQEKPMTWPEHIRQVLENTRPLQHPRGKRLPLYLWPAMNPGKLSDTQAQELVRELNRRGVALVCRWDPEHFDESLAQALPVARAQQKLGLAVSIDATACLYSFFNGDERTAHLDEAGKPFWDTSFGKKDMGCPFAIEHRRPEIRGRIERFAEAYQRAGLRVGFAWADWEIDGPMVWNDAWQAARRCVRCRERVPDVDNFLAFQKVLYELRGALQREVFAEPLRRRFPGVLVGNYGVYPHDGFRYWYDYFEREEEWYPGVRDQRALYRHWADEFTGTGYTFAMPVVYTWSRMWRWYDFDVADYRWFRPMLLEASNAGKHAWPDLPVVAFVHWHTTDPPTPSDPQMKQMSTWAYQELLWHMLLRGVDTFYLWCPAEENEEEVRLVHEVWAAAQEYGDFLEKGTPLCFDVPPRPGTVVSALLHGHRILVRRTDFIANPASVPLTVPGRTVMVPPGGGCRVLNLSERFGNPPERLSSLPVLIVADELPAMEVLGEALHDLEGLPVHIVRQADLPPTLDAYRAVIVYIHGRLEPQTETRLFTYADAGGRLILLHHSISSSKRTNREWFPKLGVELPEGDVASGGYRWIEGVTIEVANLAPRHFITSHNLAYPAQVPFPDARGRQRRRPAIRFDHSEVYLNHRLAGPRTVLLGLRFQDPSTGRVWTQPTAGWLRPLGKGHVVYFMPGHTADEFRNAAYARLIANAVLWQP